MSRVALVTGGSRGIGAAISTALKDAGYTVAATYAGNDEAAAQFTETTGIKTYKWNVADYDDSKAGIAKVEEDLGPIDVVVANAGITRDAPFHKMTPDQWNEVVGTNLTGVFNTRTKIRSHRRHQLYQRAERSVRPGELCRDQSRRSGHCEVTRAGRRARQYYRECDLPRLYRDGYGDGGAREGARLYRGANPDRPLGRTRRNRPRGCIPSQ